MARAGGSESATVARYGHAGIVRRGHLAPLLKFLGAPPTFTTMDSQRLAGELHEPDPALNMPLTPMVPAPPDTFVVQLDADAVARLRELDPEGRHGVIERVFKAFESSLVRMLGQLEAQRELGDPAVVSSVAHTLRSSAASVGALALAQTCAQVESRLRTDGPVSLGGDIERLLHDGGAALVAVRAMLRQ